MDTLVPKSNELLVFRGAFGKFRGMGPNKPLHHFTYITTEPHIGNSILKTNPKAKTHLCTPESGVMQELWIPRQVYSLDLGGHGLSWLP
jgi:hypothetical protein